MKNKQKFTIRFRVTENWNAGNGMVNGSSTESTTVAKGGARASAFGRSPRYKNLKNAMNHD